MQSAATRHPVRRRVAVRALAGLVLGLVAVLPAFPQASGEASLKVRITLSLARFAQWPGSPPESLRLCVAQRDAAIAQAFAEADGQTVNGRRIQVVKAPPLGGCHVLFVHASAERVPDLLRAIGSTATLVIGDAEGTLTHGGMVELVPVNDSLRFDINMAAVRQAQLGLSSQVLKLARQVRE